MLRTLFGPEKTKMMGYFLSYRILVRFLKVVKSKNRECGNSDVKNS